MFRIIRGKVKSVEIEVAFSIMRLILFSITSILFPYNIFELVENKLIT